MVCPKPTGRFPCAGTRHFYRVRLGDRAETFPIAGNRNLKFSVAADIPGQNPGALILGTARSAGDPQ